MKLRYMLAIILLLLPIRFCKAYSISTSGHTITVKMVSPSIGISGINAVHWSDDPDKIGRDIYESFVGFFDSMKKGTYVVKVYWKVKDSYGNNKLEYAGSYSFSAEELRKYKNYGYSKRYRDVYALISEMYFSDKDRKFIHFGK